MICLFYPFEQSLTLHLRVGDEVVIEEFLEGDELSILAFSDGYTVVALPPAQDHKRIFDGDQGPNTGGMGCYAPTRIASKEVLDEIQRTILKPTIDGLRREGMVIQATIILFLQLLTSFRNPIRGNALHRPHDDPYRPQSPRIQRPLR